MENGIPSDLTLSGIPADKLYLVRIQKSLDDSRLEKGPDGTPHLVLNRQGSGRAQEMNTFHFTLNALVKNHSFGGGWDDAGIVVISPLVETSLKGKNIPNGFLPADTYFHADEKGEMRLASPQIIAPEGIVLPQDLEAITRRYPVGKTPEETRSNRNKAVEYVFGKNQAPLRDVNFDDWIGAPRLSIASRNRLAAALAPDTKDIFFGRHANSPDGMNWDWPLNGTLSSIRDYRDGDRWETLPGGAEAPRFDRIKEHIANMKSDLEARRQNGEDPKAIAFQQRQLDRVTDAFKKDAKPQRQRELAEKTEKDLRYLASHTPPPLPPALPPPLPLVEQMPPPLPPEARRSNYAALDETASAIGHHVGNSTGVAGAAINLAEGHVGAAVANIVTTPTAIKAATEGMSLLAEAKGALPVIEAVGKAGVAIGKRIPIIGAVVTGAVVVTEVAGDAWHGDYGKAGAATAAGGAEILGNTVGFGVGDAARETVRGGIVAATGEKYAPDKSGLRQLGEEAYDLAKIRLQKNKTIAQSPAAKGQPKPS